MGTGLKDIVWVGSSKVDLARFGKAVSRAVGHELYLVQMGEDPADWKPMKSVGPGAREIRVEIDSQYRAIYVAKWDDKIHVLHAFEKKTQRTRKADIELAKQRYKNIAAEQRQNKK